MNDVDGVRPPMFPVWMGSRDPSIVAELAPLSRTAGEPIQNKGTPWPKKPPSSM